MGTNDAINKLKEIRNFDGPTMVLKNKYTIKGALIGLASGFVIASYFKFNKIIGMSLSAIAGTYIGNIYGNYAINKDKTQKQSKNVVTESDL